MNSDSDNSVAASVQPSGAVNVAARWVAVSERLPPKHERPYQVAAVCVKTYTDDSCYPGEGIKGVYQDWVVRKWPHHYAYWMNLPPLPSASDSPAGADESK